MNRLREMRLKKRLSQKDLAKLVGLSYITINRIEKGHQEPSLMSMRRLETFFGEQLFDNDVEKKK